MKLGKVLGHALHGLGSFLVIMGDAFVGIDDPLPTETIGPGDYLAEETEREVTP